MSSFAAMMSNARAAAAADEPDHIFTTVSGRAIDLVDPRPEDIDFADVAHHLALGCRYGGACRRNYPVGEHLLRGLAYCEGDAELARYWLAHDLHEFCWQDDTTPKKRARPKILAAEMAGKIPPDLLNQYRLAIETADDAAEQRHARAMHLATGLAWPVPAAVEGRVKEIDLRMLRTEWAALMPGEPPLRYLRFDPYDSFTRWPAIPSYPEIAQGLRLSFNAHLPSQFRAAARRHLAASAGAAAVSERVMREAAEREGES